MSATSTATQTYSVADIESVMRWVGVDFRMIAESTGAITLAEAGDYQADIDLLARKDCLVYVDVTLFSTSEEIRAVRYTVQTGSIGLTNSRPGSMLWPRVHNPMLQVVFRETGQYHLLKNSGDLKLRLQWGPTNVDLSHRTLTASGGRSYVSNGYGVVREDFRK